MVTHTFRHSPTGQKYHQVGSVHFKRIIQFSPMGHLEAAPNLSPDGLKKPTIFTISSVIDTVLQLDRLDVTVLNFNPQFHEF